VSKPSEALCAGEKWRGRRLAGVGTLAALVAIGGAVLQLPVGAKPTIDDRAPAPQGRSSTPSPKGPGTYQLRCWQYGRLLFDEGPVTLGPETRQGARLVATDRNGALLIVTDAGEATCMARPSAPPPSLALPR